MSSRGRPFEPGNQFGRGRPRGSRNKTSKAAKELLNSHAEPLVRKAMVMAMKENPSIMRALLGYVLPAQKETPVRIGSLPMATISDLEKASEKILKKVASGKLTITEGQGLASLIEGRREVIKTEELARRIAALESRQ